MTTFFLDLMHDLREKRLLPVAAALLAAIVAVPLVLAKGSSGEPEPAPAPKVATPDSAVADEVAAALAQAGVPGTSDLGKFNSKDPFKPANGYRKAPATPGPGSAGAGGAGGAAPGPDDGAAAADTPSGGGGSTGDTTPTTPGTGNGIGDTPPAPTFRYAADLTLAYNGRTRRIRHARKLRQLPSERNPLVVYLGVSAKGNEVTFLVDASQQMSGEGTCKPSRAACATLRMGAGSQTNLTDTDGNRLQIRVDEIHKIRIGAGAAKARAARKPASASARSKRVGFTSGFGTASDAKLAKLDPVDSIATFVAAWTAAVRAASSPGPESR